MGAFILLFLFGVHSVANVEQHEQDLLHLQHSNDLRYYPSYTLYLFHSTIQSFAYRANDALFTLVHAWKPAAYRHP